MICERVITDPITDEGQPDGGWTPILDPYEGCQFCCPYCFQWGDESWNQDVYVNTNIAELLGARLAEWPKEETIYLGSRCDPYMPLEATYQLTRECLAILDELHINTMITTKADTGLIFRDINLLKSFKAELTILMGMSNINQVCKGSQNENVLAANRLHESGVRVWAFITPVLPYIMDVEAMIAAIDPGIPVFLDKLRIVNGAVQTKMQEFVARRFLEFAEAYNAIIFGGDERYYRDLERKYANDKRVKFLF